MSPLSPGFSTTSNLALIRWPSSGNIFRTYLVRNDTSGEHGQTSRPSLVNSSAHSTIMYQHHQYCCASHDCRLPNFDSAVQWTDSCSLRLRERYVGLR